MPQSAVLYHPAAYCPECDLWSISYDVSLDSNDSMINDGYVVLCDSCDEELEATEVKRKEHEEY